MSRPFPRTSSPAMVGRVLSLAIPLGARFGSTLLERICLQGRDPSAARSVAETERRAHQPASPARASGAARRRGGLSVQGSRGASAPRVQRSCNGRATVVQRSCNGRATVVKRSCNGRATVVKRSCNGRATHLGAPHSRGALHCPRPRPAAGPPPAAGGAASGSEAGPKWRRSKVDSEPEASATASRAPLGEHATAWIPGARAPPRAAAAASPRAPRLGAEANTPWTTSSRLRISQLPSDQSTPLEPPAARRAPRVDGGTAGRALRAGMSARKDSRYAQKGAAGVGADTTPGRGGATR